MDGGVAPLGGAEHGVGVGDVAAHDLDAQLHQRPGSAVSRASARTASPRSTSCLQTLAPASPVAPVTRTVWLMVQRRLVNGRVDLVRAERDHRRTCRTRRGCG